MAFTRPTRFSPSDIGGLICRRISHGSSKLVICAKCERLSKYSYHRPSRCQHHYSPRSIWTQCICHSRPVTNILCKVVVRSFIGPSGLCYNPKMLNRLRNGSYTTSYTDGASYWKSSPIMDPRS